MDKHLAGSRQHDRRRGIFNSGGDGLIRQRWLAGLDIFGCGLVLPGQSFR